MARTIPQVLLIDDEPMVLELFSEWLTEVGCRVTTASTGLDGLALAAEPGWDLIISDVHLEPFDGFAIVEFAKRAHPGQQVVLITGRADSVCRARAAELGIPLLAKPLTMAQLLTCAEVMIEQAVRERCQRQATAAAGSLLGGECRYQPR